MITCPKCGKDNQDHYKFCLGCGAELPRDVAPKPFAPQTPPQGIRAQSGSGQSGAVAPAPPAAPAPPPAPGPGGSRRLRCTRREWIRSTRHRRSRPRCGDGPAAERRGRRRRTWLRHLPAVQPRQRNRQPLLRLLRLSPRRRTGRVPAGSHGRPGKLGRRSRHRGPHGAPGRRHRGRHLPPPRPGRRSSDARPAASSPATATFRRATPRSASRPPVASR